MFFRFSDRAAFSSALPVMPLSASGSEPTAKSLTTPSFPMVPYRLVRRVRTGTSTPPSP
jgi:hypothetical protein